MGKVISLKLLHTADLHLTAGAPERMDALRIVCAMAGEFDCSAIVISGDLFDTPEAALDLRAEVRELFESAGCGVFLIPGNHDAAAFCSGEHYGRNVQICSGPEPVRWEVDGVPIIGVPYLPGRKGWEALHSLDLDEVGSPLVILMHANFYNSALSARYFLDEDDPSAAACLWDCDFVEFPPAYIALGHWHNPTLPPVTVNNVKIAYSGTPCPTAKGETGRRRVFLVDVSPEGVVPQGVDVPGVPRRETRSFYFVPGGEEETFEEIRLTLEKSADQEVILDLEIEGWVGELSEEACLGEIRSLVNRYHDRWRVINLCTPQITGVSSLPGIARRCLQFLREMPPPGPLALDDCQEPCLQELAQQVWEDRDGLYRTALSLVLRQLGSVKQDADS